MSAASRRSRARLTATAEETTATDESRAHGAPSAPRRRRRTLQPRAIATIALAWMLLWDRLSWGNLINGVLIGLFVTLAFPLPSIEFQGRLRPHRVAWLIVLFLADLVAASWQVLRLALGRRRPRNAVIGVQLRSRSDFYLTLTAELVALVPGSVVVDARRSTSVLYLHLLDIEREGAIEHQRRHVLAVEERVVRAFGSREEIAHLEQAKGAAS
ncbi:multisubunit sodium/proton antiporter MrpE subunit [Humibacillus xanthopallidus]|uniref:Multisubunit sodium/proton antiporter MrpE subunit n=1 Tax=Humibacillus xanthopallidus TaxID=412689 RepID=A0A543PXV9_9MICO|nr:Na+/H+ antiporter subunit E [Humibacillus xanthopallidus]TQN48913.1 multisubunit sodium/proton antiporter MrpE subunit [Humibacillus xanthopallidus]